MSSMKRREPDLGEGIWVDSSTEDGLSVPMKPPRITPRNSLGGNPSPTMLNPTPQADLRHLAAIIRQPSTPGTRCSSIGAPLSQRHVATSNVNRSRTPSTRQPLQPTFGNRSNPTTPHAIRAMQQRRATPGHDRRKSGWSQRETPRDILRNLSKALASTTQAIKPSPLPLQAKSNEPQDDEVENDEDLPQPRFSIAIDDGTGEDDSFQEPPPRLSMPLEDGEPTGRSVEIARRTTNERALGRLSRGNLGSIRTSDRFGNISDSGCDDTSQSGIDESTAQPEREDDADELGYLETHSESGGNTEDLRRAMLEGSGPWRSLSDSKQQARQLDVGVLSPFVLKLPRFDPTQSFSLAMSLDEQSLQNNDDPLKIEDQDESDVLQIESCLHKPVNLTKIRKRVPKTLKRSRHRISYASLPCGVIKKIASTCTRAMGIKKTSISNDSLKAIIEASDRYFEQFSGDLGAFAHHAGRKKIDESDVIAVMKRQRKVSATSTPFFLAQKYLPGEQLQSMRMPLPKLSLGQRGRRLEVIEEDDDVHAL